MSSMGKLLLIFLGICKILKNNETCKNGLKYFFGNFHNFSVLGNLFQRSLPKIRIFRFFLLFIQNFGKEIIAPIIFAGKENPFVYGYLGVLYIFSISCQSL